MLIYKENETLKHENRLLREKVTVQENEMYRLSQSAKNSDQYLALQDEVERLSRALLEQDRAFEV